MDAAMIQPTKKEAQKLEDPKFISSVEVYKKEEKKVVIGFIHGMVHLGRILSDQRDVWKKKKKWEQFLEATGVSVSGANKMINVYEYAKQNIKKLEQSNVDNWKKVGVFLALPDELKDKMAIGVDGENLSTEEFVQTADEMQIDNVDIVPMKEDPIPEDMENLLDQTTIADVPLLADRLIERLQESGIKISKESLPAAIAYLSIEKVTREIESGGFDSMSKPEMNFWLKRIKNAANKIVKTKI